MLLKHCQVSCLWELMPGEYFIGSVQHKVPTNYIRMGFGSLVAIDQTRYPGILVEKVIDLSTDRKTAIEKGFG